MRTSPFPHTVIDLTIREIRDPAAGSGALYLTRGEHSRTSSREGCLYTRKQERGIGMEAKRIKTAPPVLSASLRDVEEGLACLQEARREDMLVEQCRIKGLMAEEEDFYKINLEGVVLENCTFLHCNFEKASFIDVQFKNCDFSNSILDDCYFNRCEFLCVKGVGTDFHESLFKETRWEECGLSFANFSGTRWEAASLSACDMQESYLADCRFKKVDWQAMNLKRASFFHTSLKGMDLRGNEVEGIIVSEEKKELIGAVTDIYQAAELAKLMGLVIK